MKLYELTNQLTELTNLDLPDEDIADTVEALEGEITDKAESLLAVVSNIGADVDAIDAEIKRLQARKKTIANRQNWLREYLRSNMEAHGIDKITCPLFTITLRKATQVVAIDDMNLLPDLYIKTVRSADKMAIKGALESGTDVPGASMTEGKRGLMIK